MEHPSEAAHACSGVEEAPITTVWQTAIWTVSLRHHCFGDLSSGFALVFLLCFVRLCSFFWSCSVFDHSRPPYFLIQLTHILAALETSACDTCDLWTIKKNEQTCCYGYPALARALGPQKAWGFSWNRVRWRLRDWGLASSLTVKQASKLQTHKHYRSAG